jgi:hypothetical protein
MDVVVGCVEAWVGCCVVGQVGDGDGRILPVWVGVVFWRCTERIARCRGGEGGGAREWVAFQVLGPMT